MTKSILGISRNNLAGDAVQHILSIGNPLQNLPVSAIIDFLLYGDAVFCEPLHMLCIVVQLEGLLIKTYNRCATALQRYSWKSRQQKTELYIYLYNIYII